MDEYGKKFDVLIEDNIGRDPSTGIKKFFGLIVWTDINMKDIIKNIPGIHTVSDYGTCYYVSLDPRYDKNFIEAEIEAQIKINLK